MKVKIKGCNNKEHLAVESTTGHLVKRSQLRRPCSRSTVLIGSHADFNHSDVCWESNTVGCKQSRRLLECTENNFLVQVLDTPTKCETLLDLVLTNAEEITKELKIRDSLSYRDYALVEFMISRKMGPVKS